MKLLTLLGKFSAGGTERVVSHLTVHLPESVKNTIIITEPRVDYPYRGTLRQIELPPFIRRRQYHIHLTRFLKKFFETRRIIRSLKPDVVIAFAPSWGLLGALLSNRLVFFIYTTPSSGFGTSYVKKLHIRFICWRARAVVCISEGVKKDLFEKFGVRKAVVIHSPVDTKLISECGAQAPAESKFETFQRQEGLTFISAGRASMEKGFQHLIRAFADVRGKVACKLVLMGEGVDANAYFRELAEALGVVGDVLFLGFQTNPFSYFQRADIFVLPSVREGLSLVSQEAMACGLPVISADCKSGPREILAPDTSVAQVATDVEYAKYGILVPPLDGRRYGGHDPLTRAEQCLARAMHAVLEDKKIRVQYGNASRSRAVTSFGMDRFIQETYRLFSRVAEYRESVS